MRRSALQSEAVIGRSGIVCSLSPLLTELLKESRVSGIKQADIADAVLHHGDAVDSHAEGEAADFLRIVGGLLALHEAEDCGVDHAAAEQLDPARVLALAAALAAAEGAADLHICAGFGEGEERGKEARFDARAEELLHGVVERALEVGEGDVGVNAEALD